MFRTSTILAHYFCPLMWALDRPQAVGLTGAAMEIPLSDRLRQSNNAINLTCSTTKKLKFFGGEATQVIAAPVMCSKNKRQMSNGNN